MAFRNDYYIDSFSSKKLGNNLACVDCEDVVSEDIEKVVGRRQ